MPDSSHAGSVPPPPPPPSGEKTPGTQDSLRLPGATPLPGAGMPPGAPASGSTPYAGRKLGQYTLLEKVGQGGMGAVFRAFDTALERTVALKVLFSSAFDETKHAERFLREARSLARLNHPNLVHVYNVGQENDCYFFAMELIEGETLSAALRRRRRIPTHEMLPIIGQILSALHYVHRQGIMHRDMKSGNIMVSGRRAVLMDFGLAKDDHFAGLTSAGSILGTPDYMSPESAEGKSAGPPTDLYSLGIVMYEALGGGLPFAGKSALSIIKQHMEVPPPPIEALLPNIDPLLASCVHKCLAKNPLDRYANCAALAADLVRVHATPELKDLAEDLLNEAPVTAARSKEEMMAGSADITFSADDPGALDATLTAAQPSPRPSGSGTRIVEAGPLDATLTAARPVSDATLTMGPSPAARESGLPRTPAEPEAPEADAGTHRPLVWLALGFFGMILLVIFLGQLGKNRDSEPTEGHPAVMRRSGEVPEEIRLIEFKTDGPDPSQWTYTLLRKKDDGRWEKQVVPHSEAVRDGDVLELIERATQNPGNR